LEFIARENCSQNGYILQNKTVRYFSEAELAKLAKQCREATSTTRAQAAREMKVAQTSIFHAEESPEKSLTKLRLQMIEEYSSFKVIGPVFLLKRK
jgi:hypothetical protein